VKSCPPLLLGLEGNMVKPLYSKKPVDAKAFQKTSDKFYTKTARLYDFGVKVLPGWKTWLRRALPHIQGRRVLEVSFGTGYLLMQYANKFETHGIDLNARLVAVAKRNLEKRGVCADLTQGNVEQLPYVDEYFDTVMSTMALSGYPDVMRAMSETMGVRLTKRSSTFGSSCALVDTCCANAAWLRR
jgi:ubiquinone/menaquinone biosynthesis C-methylase UbiE